MLKKDKVRYDRNGREIKSDKQLETEANAAICKVLRTTKDTKPSEVRQTILRAFPFGTEAGQREKRVWEEQVKLAMREFEKMASYKHVMAVALVLFAMVLPAQADTTFSEVDRYVPQDASPYTIQLPRVYSTDGGGYWMVPPSSSKLTKKQRFKRFVDSFPVEHPYGHFILKYGTKTLLFGLDVFAKASQIKTGIQ